MRKETPERQVSAPAVDSCSEGRAALPVSGGSSSPPWGRRGRRPAVGSHERSSDGAAPHAWSVIHCLPVGMIDADSAGTGAVIRPETVRRYAAEAGFAQVKVLPIEHESSRFHRLAM